MSGTLLDIFTSLFKGSFTGIAILSVIIILLWLVIRAKNHSGEDREESEATIKDEFKNSEDKKVEQVLEIINPQENKEIVAAIMAALSAHIGTPVSDLNIKSIKRVNGMNSNWQKKSIEDKLKV